MRKGTMEEEGKLFHLVEAAQSSQKDVDFLIKGSLQWPQGLLSGSASYFPGASVGRKVQNERAGQNSCSTF